MMMKPLALVLAALLVLTTACGTKDQTDRAQSVPPEPLSAAAITTPATTQALAIAPKLPVTVKDKYGRNVTISDLSRVISLSGDFTEVIFALGLGEYVVAVDTSATYPPEAKQRATIGYQRALAAEGILAQRPTLVLGNENAGPPAVIEQLRGAGVPVVILQYSPAIESAATKVRAVAEVLGVPERGVELAARVQTEIEAAKTLAATASAKPKVAFLNVRGAGTQQIWGKGTPADAMLNAAGALNAATLAGIDGSKPITAESVVAAGPNVLIVTTSALESAGGVDGLLTLPGLALTPAGKSRTVLSFEDQYLLGMGPRTGQALLELVKALHPALR